MNEYEFTLADRLDAIRKADLKYDLNKNAYISFSGGKDSTVLHYLIDLALPGNTIPRVYADTGIEFLDVRDFVKGMKESDDRFIIISPSRPIKPILEEYGYPFKSKEHSHLLMTYQHSGFGKSVKYYLGIEGRKMVQCPKALRYQFSPQFSIKVSDLCCKKMKKEPFAKWQKQSSRTIAITGMRQEEGGQRKSLKGCIITDKRGSMIKFHPLFPTSDEFENDFIERNSIQLCRLYYPPFNFKRTGCKGCPFALELEDQLALMEIYLPIERRQCESIWKPIYDEYRRLGYRLNKDEQLRLF